MLFVRNTYCSLLLVFFSFLSVNASNNETNTTTHIPPTTTTPIPQPETGKWNVTNKEGDVICIYLQAAIQLTLTYKNKTKDNSTHVINVPTSATASGFCGQNANVTAKTENEPETLSLVWSTTKIDNLSLTFFFDNDKNHTSQTDGDYWTMYRVIFTMTEDDNSTQLYADESASFTNFKVKTGHFWSCSPKVDYKKASNSSSTFITLKDTKIQAYATNTTLLQSAHYCPQEDQTNDLVPIIVGAALAALVVVVLIAYLIGRVRAKRSTGYESV